jgi:hypothetical protein
VKIAPALRRKNDVEMERLNVHVPKEDATSLRVRCARERRSIADGVTAAIRDWVKKETA